MSNYVEQLRDDIDGLIHERDRLRDDKQIRDEIIEERELEIAELNEEVEYLRKIKGELESGYSSLAEKELEIAELKVIVDRQQRDKNDLSNRVNTLEYDNEQLRIRLNKAQRRATQESERVGELLEEKSSFMYRINNLEGALTKKDEIIQMVEREKAALEGQLRNKDEAIQELHYGNLNLRRQLKEHVLKDVNDHLKAKIPNAIFGGRGEHDEWKCHYEALKKRCAHLCDEILHLRNEVGTREARIEKLESGIRNVLNRHKKE